MTLASDVNDRKIVELVDRAIESYEGQGNDIEGAIGALFLGRKIGWKPLFLMHDKKKIKKYESVLGVAFKDILSPVGEAADKSVAWKRVKMLSNFWKAVTGNIPEVRSNLIARR